MNQAQTQTAPIENQAGANAGESRNFANQTLAGAGSTLDTANPTYASMASTGGFTPGQESNYINRATESATAAGNVASDQAKLAAAKTGQGNPQAAISRIARQMGQNASQATNDAETSLNQQENANKLSGAGGLVSSANARTNIGNTESTMSNQSAQQQLQALGLQFNSEAEAQQALDQLSNNAGPLNNILAVAGTAMGRPNSGATSG